jgi:peroxiredoxin (alkyl hydroperoxide reductase subunit C)
MSESTESCVKSAKGPISHVPSSESNHEPGHETIEVRKMLARVGKPAPDFEANAYQSGAFKNVKLTDFKGSWVVLCFYPGDFTFV